MKESVRYLLVLGISAFIFVSFAGSGPAARLQDPPAYKNPNIPVEKRVEDLLARMTLREKIAMLGGTGFTTTPILRLGIPALKMDDGPLGVRWGKSTAFPAATCMAASWDTSMIFQVGKAIAQEVKGKGRDEVLGPCVNIARIPMGGRTFEAYGEDPYLTSRMAVSYIEGVQSQGVAATVKHFAANNQEYERMFVNAEVSERALNEIYLPAFKAAVEEAHVLAVMCAYNKVNGEYCTANNYLLDTKLKQDWGFKGLVMSDWGAVHSTIPVANGGMDLEMPTGEFLNDSTLLPAIKSGKVKESTIDNKVRRILTVMFKLGLFDHTRSADSALVNTPEHQAIAYRAAVEGIVLLKNDRHVLPLNSSVLKSIAVIGPNAAVARTTGGGSAMVDPIYSVSPLEALKARLGGKVTINFAEGVRLAGQVSPIPAGNFYQPNSSAHGLAAEYFDNMDLKGNPAVRRVDKKIDFAWNGKSPAPGLPADSFSARWTGRFKSSVTGRYIFDLSSDDGSRLYIDNQLVIDNWGQHAPEVRSFETRLEKGKSYGIRVDYFQAGGGSGLALGLREAGGKLIEKAAEAARKSQVALLFVGTSSHYETEGRDRDSLGLPGEQAQLIRAVAKANRNTVVVMISGAPVTMSSWLGKVPALVQAWFGGDEAGNAIADVLLGKHDPSGRLPITFPEKWSDCSAYSTYKHQDSVSVYSDGVFVGYRWFDEHNIKPLFPFGYGLSYTKFDYSDLTVTPAGEDYRVTFDVKNTGKVAGVAIPQLYVHDPDPAAAAPVKELKRFDRVTLRPGQRVMVTFFLRKSDFAHYVTERGGWYTHPGEYDVLVGSSSRNIILRGKVKI